MKMTNIYTHTIYYTYTHRVQEIVDLVHHEIIGVLHDFAQLQKVFGKFVCTIETIFLTEVAFLKCFLLIKEAKRQNGWRKMIGSVNSPRLSLLSGVNRIEKCFKFRRSLSSSNSEEVFQKLEVLRSSK